MPAAATTWTPLRPGGAGQARGVACQAVDRLIDDQAAAIGGEGLQLGFRDAGVGLMRVGRCLVRAVVDLPPILRPDLGPAVPRGSRRHDVEQDMFVERDGADPVGGHVA